NKNNLSHADLFRSLRGKDVEHLGQVNKAFFETSGLISVIFQPPKKVRSGLSLIPEEYVDETAYLRAGDYVTIANNYSCVKCGYTKSIKQMENLNSCIVCNGTVFLKSDN
ncbi:MAG: DUF421 domain-containing protein, partial [Rickettsia endosymbiont of Ixodes persulcatus]|nr:DUF421 domain-containing protein [Rickettsia endosymbiont of Ixodes persulcatus]